MAAMGPVTALVYQSLWLIADDYGTAPCDPDRLKGELFYAWSAVSLRNITDSLRALSDQGRIATYAVGDDMYCTIERWDRHQAVHKPGKFRYPTDGQQVTVGSADISGDSPEISEHSHHLDSKTPRHLDTKTPRLQDSQTKTTALVLVAEKKPIPESQLATAIAEWLPMELAWDQMVDGAVRVVFSYWVAKTGRDANRTWLTPERKTHLRARLQESPKGDIAAATSPLLWAVDGVMSSSFHVEGGHTKLEQLFRNRSRLEGFAEKISGYQRAELHPLVNGG